MYVQRLAVSDLTTTSGGAATGYTAPCSGRVLAVIYTKDGSNAFDDGVDFTVTAEATAQAIVTLTDQNTSTAVYPRAQVHGVTGTALTLDGTRINAEPIVIANDRVKVVVAQGGNAKTGAITIILG